MEDELLTPQQVHTHYRIAPQTLANYRWRGEGPAYIKTSPARSGRVLYRRSAIEQWLTERTVIPAGQPA
ncbi:helix-turn-helix domain-containing protein [Streptomyces sp. DSM 41972]|uniref:Helix-turn-helix domain-containing protein n=1 Tax=Streptomyces althioticus subsp. attaecolombicae TaxID=3075534 RepID=A0ABU3HW11_9ACTN|nr:helix-turn-helix domain-containing protein [Streptomyces sp. DSM 41972]SCD67533.1 Helix-turn-helix domain-containing protein [Streptomyces sp. di50b]SCD75617.1 Helix-turn-helix domain-containing protein [Streptomyces sp. di188]